ncbi:Uncharacterised protein [Nocardia asteroides]|nr:hypothetical protein SAMN05444423_10380 [Nocardia asteroides]VEG33572.1 Uncharacterised protein [Nocardia asteroides]
MSSARGVADHPHRRAPLPADIEHEPDDVDGDEAAAAKQRAPLFFENSGARVRDRLTYSAFSSSVTAPTDFLASPNSMEVWSA